MENFKEKRTYRLNKLLLFCWFFVLATTLSEEEKRLDFRLSVAAFEGDNQSCDESWFSSVEIAMLGTADNPLDLLLTFDKYDESSNSFSVVTDYFQVDSLADLVWSHRTNSQSLLNQARESCAHIVEVDIFEGRVAHDFGSSSNLSFEELFACPLGICPGIKLDIKNIESLAPVLNAVEQNHFNGPLFINMNLLSGPGNNHRLKEDEIEYFIQQTNRFPGTVLSLGWFTKGNSHEIYTIEMIEEMITLVKKYGLEQRLLTFPINLLNLPGSKEALQLLLKEFPEATLTVYLSNKNDYAKDKVEHILDEWPFLEGRVMRDF